MRAVVTCVLLLAACQATPKAEERLVPLVHDKDRGVRYAAVMALGKAGTGETALAEALRDPEWCVRAEAAVALARVGPRALPLVLEAARDPDREVRLESWTALRKLGTDAIREGRDALRKGLASADAEERLEAARCLVLLGPEEDGEILPVLVDALQSVNDRDLICGAAWCARRMGPRAAATLMPMRRLLLEEKFKYLDTLRAAIAAVKPEPAPSEPALTEAAAREKLAGDEIEGVLDGAIGLEKLGIDPRPLLAARDGATAARVFVILGPGTTPPPERWLSSDDAAVRESAAIALGQRGSAANVFVDTDPRVRAAAVWSHGRAGIPMPEAMRNTDPVIREMAVRTLGLKELAAALMDEDVAVRRLAASRCAEERIFVPELLSAARAEDLDVRILSVRALSRCGKPCLPALQDTNRAVRMEAVLGLSADHEEELLHALVDEDWRIRRAALQRLGPSKRAAEAAAPFVGDLNPLLSEAAADALSRMQADAALPLARTLPGNRAVQYHAPRILEALGASGAAAVPTLVPLLRDPDVNVRECAARCLTGIGPGAREASAALVAALGDPRLCVVSHAALALGRIGITPELEHALSDARARVRAYAAFAYGWACGDARGIDQVPFEVRLPVLDCGDAPPGRFPELRSKDPTVAIPCAAARSYEELDAWESERVMELLLPGGCRAGAPGDFDEFRGILGSAELPAQMQYLVRARRTAMGKEYIFGQNHRIARRENIPAFLWFARTEDDASLTGVGQLYMPINSTYDPSQYVKDPGGLRGPGLPPALREWLKPDTDLWVPCGLWWLNEVTPLESDAPALLDFARWAFHPGGDENSRAAAVRVLGRVHDAASERLLREVAARTWPPGYCYATGKGLPLLALASLARRGHPDALGALAEYEPEPWMALGPLLEAAPGFATAWLRARLLDPGAFEEGCETLRQTLRELSPQGVRLDGTLFAGFAEAAIASKLDGHALARIAVTVPGCRRAALAEVAFSRLDPKAWLPEDEEDEIQPDLDAAAFLYSADPERFVAVLRRWSNDTDERVRRLAIRMLLHIGDPRSADKLVAAAGRADYEMLARTHAPAVERFLIEQAEAGSDEARGGLFEYLGITSLFPQDVATTVKHMQTGEAIPELLNGLANAEERKVYPELGLLKDPRVLGWLREQWRARAFPCTDLLGALVLAGDRDARAELWSIVRCGRHFWLYSHFDERIFTLDWDFSTLPHWTEELDSNCCRVAGGLEDIFMEELGLSWLYGRPWSGLGEPRSQKARTDLLWYGGSFVRSPLVDHFVARPD